MKKLFSKSNYLMHKKNFIIGNWRFICIETNLPNKNIGYIFDDEINIITDHIDDSGENKVLLMHHHPRAVGNPLIDKYIIDNRDIFLNKITTLSQIKLIICGHVHGNYSIKINNNLVMESGPAAFVNYPGYKIYYFSDC